jgi:geranylgeranyl diphosphate synthase, type II
MTNRKTLLEIFNKFLQEEKIIKEPYLLYEPIQYTLETGGKRIRPILLLMAYELFKDDVESALYTALGLETFHNFTLLHDDIMDNSAMRRGNPTVHSNWNSNIAILSGDAMNILATQYMLKAPRNHLKLLESFTNVAIKVCEGQQYDMDYENRKTISESEYIQMISLKTGALLAGALEMGGIIADANQTDIQKLYEFGMNMGIGFQIQDDWLDCFGDPSKFGKIIGKDILSEKKTFLFIKAYEFANQEQKNTLDHAFSNDELPASDKIEFVLNIFKEIGIHDLALKKSEEYFMDAENALLSISIEDSKKQELKLFLGYLRNRSF